jgi:hypothetical protein
VPSTMYKREDHRGLVKQLRFSRSNPGGGYRRPDGPVDHVRSLPDR